MPNEILNQLDALQDGVDNSLKGKTSDSQKKTQSKFWAGVGKGLQSVNSLQLPSIPVKHSVDNSQMNIIVIIVVAILAFMVMKGKSLRKLFKR